jgi:hypothetical protein
MATSYKPTMRAAWLGLLFGFGIAVPLWHLLDVHSRSVWSLDGIVQVSISFAAGGLGMLLGWKVDQRLTRRTVPKVL